MEGQEFNKLSEMTSDEIIGKLPRCRLRLEKSETRYGVRFNAYVLVDDKLHIRCPIDEATFYVVASLRKQDSTKGVYEVSFPYRIVEAKGHRSDGSEFGYAYVEGYACPREKKVYLHQFLHGSEYDLLQIIQPAGLIDRGFVENADGEHTSYFDDLA